MRFFSTVSVVFTAALAAFSVAAPVAEAETKDVVRSSNPSIASLWSAAFNQINPQAQSFMSLDPSTATQETVQPKLENIQKSLQDLQTNFAGLQTSGASMSQLLTSADGSSELSVSDLASTMAGDITILVNGLGAVHGCGGLGVALSGLLAAIGLLLYAILKIVLGLVAGLLLALTPLLGGLVGTLGLLGLDILVTLLCL